MKINAYSKYLCHKLMYMYLHIIIASHYDTIIVFIVAASIYTLYLFRQ